jgi:methyltransferase (TIGR00027 family)
MIPLQPSRTAWRVAVRRAVHQLLDQPPVLNDPLAVSILGAETAASLRAAPAQFETGRLSPYMRAFFAVRSRFAEDQLAAARARGVRQYVVLGAGLDTFAYRDPSPGMPLRVWEVDFPATQAWKRERLAEASIAEPPTVTYVPIDFERQALPDVLGATGFDPTIGAVFSWLGVVPYLTRDAIMATLRYVASVTAAGGGVAFDFGIPPERLSLTQRRVFDALAARVSAAGEPWRTFFEPDDLARELHELGFSVAHSLSGEAINARYFADRSDGLAVGGMGHLMWAGASPVA